VIPRWVIIAYFFTDYDKQIEKGLNYGCFASLYLFLLGASMFVIWGGSSPSRYEFVGLFWILIYKLLIRTFDGLTIPKLDKYMMSFCYMFFLTELWHIYDEVPRIISTGNPYLFFYFLADMVMIIPFALIYKEYFTNLIDVLAGTAVIGVFTNILSAYLDHNLFDIHYSNPIYIILLQRGFMSIACIGLILYLKKGVKQQWSK